MINLISYYACYFFFMQPDFPLQKYEIEKLISNLL